MNTYTKQEEKRKGSAHTQSKENGKNQNTFKTTTTTRGSTHIQNKKNKKRLKSTARICVDLHVLLVLYICVGFSFFLF